MGISVQLNAYLQDVGEIGTLINEPPAVKRAIARVNPLVRRQRNRLNILIESKGSVHPVQRNIILQSVPIESLMPDEPRYSAELLVSIQMGHIMSPRYYRRSDPFFAVASRHDPISGQNRPTASALSRVVPIQHQHQEWGHVGFCVLAI